MAEWDALSTPGGNIYPNPETDYDQSRSWYEVAVNRDTRDAATLQAAADYTDGKSWDRGGLPLDTDVDFMRGPEWTGDWSISGGSIASTMLGTKPPGMASWLPGQITVHGSVPSTTNLSSQTYRPYQAGSGDHMVWERTINAFSQTGAAAWSTWKNTIEASSGGGENTVIASSESGITNALLLERFKRARGGSIGTGGTGAVSVRWDHYTDAAAANLVPLHRKYAIPAGWAHYSQQLGENGNNVPWATLADYSTNDGFEPWSHSRTHNDATDTAGYVSEIVTSQAELQANFPRDYIDKFVIPGVGGTNYGGFISTNSPDDWYGTEAGRLALSTYAVTSGHMGGRLRPLMGEPQQGLAHVGIEETTAAAAIAMIQEAQSAGAGIQLMLHPNQIGMTGKTTLADYEAILAYMAAERDAGRLAVLSMSGLLCADVRSSYRHDLLVNSDFNTDLAGWTANGWAWSSVNTGEISTSGTGELTQTVDMNTRGWAMGGVREVVAKVRSRNGTGVTAQLRRGTTTRELVIPAGDTGWHYIRMHGTVSRLSTTQTIGLSRTAGDYLHAEYVKMLAC